MSKDSPALSHVTAQGCRVVGKPVLRRAVKIRGKEVVVDLGDRAHLTHTAAEAVSGMFGVYVSGATTALDPFVIRNFHVDGKTRR